MIPSAEHILDVVKKIATDPNLVQYDALDQLAKDKLTLAVSTMAKAYLSAIRVNPQHWHDIASDRSLLQAMLYVNGDVLRAMADILRE